MNGQQFWALVALLVLAVLVVRRDQRIWSKLPARPTPQRSTRHLDLVHAVSTRGTPSSDGWLDEVQAWGDELDGTAQLRRAAGELGRANVYATVSADVAAQQARVRGEVA